MNIYVKVETQKNNMTMLKILKRYKSLESTKTRTYSFVIQKSLLKINFTGDFLKLIYTLKWIDDILDAGFKEKGIVDRLAAYISNNWENLLNNYVFKAGFTFLFWNQELDTALSNFSQAVNITKSQESVYFNIDFYSKLKYGKIINLQTKQGIAKMQVIKVESHNLVFSLFWVGTLNDNIDVRIHYQCETSEIFQSLHCDCKEQLEIFLNRIFQYQKGMIIYCHEEGRGNGLFNKINAYYEIENNETNTRKAMEIVAGKTENRFFEIPADIIFQKQIKSINLFTNNPLKITPFKYRWVDIKRISIWSKNLSQKAKKYTKEKIQFMGHINENYN